MKIQGLAIVKYFIGISAVALSIAIAGCSSVGIQVPKAGETLTTQHQFTIQVHPDAAVSTFWVKLDNDDITNLFGQVSAGSIVKATPPALRRPHPDVNHHTITAHADWVGGPRVFGATTVGHDFNALFLSMRPVDSSTIVCEEQVCCMQLHEGQTAQMRVELAEAPYHDLEILLTTQDRNISIEGQPAGTSATVVIPSTDRYVVFSVKGITIGDVYVTASASATEPAQYKVCIR